MTHTAVGYEKSLASVRSERVDIPHETYGRGGVLRVRVTHPILWTWTDNEGDDRPYTFTRREAIAAVQAYYTN